MLFSYAVVKWPLMKLGDVLYEPIMEVISEPFRIESVFCPTNNDRIARELGKNSSSFN